MSGDPMVLRRLVVRDTVLHAGLDEWHSRIVDQSGVVVATIVQGGARSEADVAALAARMAAADELLQALRLALPYVTMAGPARTCIAVIERAEGHFGTTLRSAAAVSP